MSEPMSRNEKLLTRLVDVIEDMGSANAPVYGREGNWVFALHDNGFFQAWYTAREVELKVSNAKGNVWESNKAVVPLPAVITVANNDYDGIHVQASVSSRLFGAWCNVYGVDANGITYTAFSAVERGTQTSYRVDFYITGYRATEGAQ